MPRNGPATRRELAPDPVYRSVLVTQVVNKILSRGKRTLAERIVYGALDLVQERSGGDPVAALKRAVENPRPELEVKSRQVLDVLAELGLASGKTHSSSIEDYEAEKVRAQFDHALQRQTRRRAIQSKLTPF